MHRKVLGERHPDTIYSFYKLADILVYRGKLAEAEAASREALTRNEAIKGKDFPDFPQSWLDGLTRVLRAEGKSAEATVLTQEWMAKSELAFSEGLASQPGQFILLYDRAYLRGRMGRWGEAVADLSRIVELMPNERVSYWFLATALVKCGNLEASRRLRAQIRERFGRTDSPEGAHFLAKACLILPSSDPEDVVGGSRLADIGVQFYKGDLRLFVFQSCKALAEYRQGRFASAAEWASKALSQPEYAAVIATLNETRGNCRKVEANMVLAMSNYQLHQLEEARAVLARGLKIADTKLPKIESGDLGPYWPDWVFADMLMHEAKALIEGEGKAAGETNTNDSASLRKDPP
jgi:tetratricopeptide (TPR) repeat protein